MAHNISLLLDAICSRHLSAFKAIILPNPVVFCTVATPCQASLPTLLHTCLPHNPPPEIVLKMTSTTPDSRVVPPCRIGRVACPFALRWRGTMLPICWLSSSLATPIRQLAPCLTSAVASCRSTWHAISLMTRKRRMYPGEYTVLCPTMWFGCCSHSLLRCGDRGRQWYEEPTQMRHPV